MPKKKKPITSDKLFLNETGIIAADEIVDAIATSIPGINIAYKLAKAYMGRGMKLRQQRVLEWVEFVRDNLGSFSQQLFGNEQFQDCFVLLTEAYIKERAQFKKGLHKKILLGVTELSSEELAQYELEKMIHTTNLISFEALNVLSFIKTELLEKIEADIQEQLKVYSDREGVEGIRLKEITRARIIVSEYISRWVYDNYNTDSPKVKTKYGYTNDSPADLRKKITYKEHLKSKDLMGPLPELANLGILIRKNGAPTYGGSVGSGYSLSEFGYKYMEYVQKI